MKNRKKQHKRNSIDDDKIFFPFGSFILCQTTDRRASLVFVYFVRYFVNW